ncbi:MAG: FAD-dependent oxidoreductase, partial [Planctomycetota bacterium]
AGNRDDTASACAFAGPIPGLWCLNDAARLDEDVLAQAREPVGAARIGRDLAEMIHEHWDGASAPDGKERPIGKARHAAPAVPADRPHLEVREQDRPQVGRTYDLCDVEAVSVPVVHTADVLVVGGGSSGSVAAIAAAREGMQTVLVDMNPGLGGTGTFGGIDLFWFPRPIGYFGELYDRIGEMHDRLHLPRPRGIMPSCNIVARLWVLMDAAEDAGVTMLFNSMAVAAIVEADAVRGVVAATPVGPVALLGKVVIDATGDGDVAAFAGADNVLGSEREHVVMYAYMPEAEKPGRYRNIKTSMLDVTNVEDYTRMILAERRRRRDGDHDHGVYLAPRESRHVIGDVTLTLTDQLLQRCWPDVVYVAFSNCDIKGQTTSDWHRMGLQCPNLEIEIPYRALLPRGLDGILVAGKAYSATHDAIAGPRMQPDLENLGGVVGHAAAMAVRSGTSPKRIDVRALQTELVEKGLLPESALSRTPVPLHCGDDELQGLIDSLDGEKPLHSYSDMDVGDHFEGRIPIVDILCAGPPCVPLLEKALAEAAGPRQLLLAQALAAVGSSAGVPVLVSAIEGHLAGGRLPERTAEIRHAGLPPNQCGAPDAAYLLYSLGMTRDDRALPVWRHVVDLLATTTEQEVLGRYVAHYYYVDAVCYGAERLGDPRAVPILGDLHACAPLHGHQCRSGHQVDWFKERLAHLEVVIGRSLARCGSVDGCAILIEYLADTRAILAEHAHAELAAISGCDLGKDPTAWRAWLAEQGESLAPAPWSAPPEPVSSWNQEPLI